MSREIKFRGKHKLDGKWAVGNLVKMFGEWCIQNPNVENDMYIIDPETIGQYTGINDKHKKEIYEGSSVKRTYTHGPLSWESDFIGKVKLLEGCWVIDSGSDAMSLWCESDVLELLEDE